MSDGEAELEKHNITSTNVVLTNEYEFNTSKTFREINYYKTYLYPMQSEYKMVLKPNLSKMLKSIELKKFDDMLCLLPNEHKKLTEILDLYIDVPCNRKIVVLKAPEQLQVNCSSQQLFNALTGGLRSIPAKVIDVFTFDHEFDILEIRLFELYDVVDEFVLVESNVTLTGMQKSFYFKQNFQRYRRFLDKVKPLYITVSEENVKTYAPAINKNRYLYYIMENIWDNYKAHYGKQINENSVVVYSSIDEIPSRQAILLLKNCNVKSYPVSFMSTMYYFSFSYTFEISRYLNVPEFQHILRFPQAIDVHMLENSYFGNFKHLRETEAHRYIGLGVHLSYFMNCASMIIKAMRNADWKACLPLELFKTNASDKRKSCFDVLVKHREVSFKQRIKSVKFLLEEERQLKYIPWIIFHNKKAYDTFI